MSVTSSPQLKPKYLTDIGGGTSCGSSNMSLDDNASRGSITGVSLEYDDYPLDLISPLVVNPYADNSKNTDLGLQTDNELHIDMAAIFKNVWKPPSPPPMRDKAIDRTIGDEMITDYGRRSWCDYPENSDINSDVFVNYRTSLCLSSSQSQRSNHYTDRDIEIPRDTSEETRFIQNEDDEDYHRSNSNNSSSSGNNNNCCHSCKQRCFKLWKPCLLRYHPLPSKPGWLDKLKHACMCPPHGPVSRILSLSFTGLALWAVCWAFLGSNVLPGGQLFIWAIMAVLSYLAGRVMQLFKAPPIIGMLASGIVLRNVPGIHIAKDIDDQWSATVRSIGLVLFLLHTSLSMDIRSLRKKMSAPVLRLATLPCIVEAVVITVPAHFILKLPWTWAVMLGVLLSSSGCSVIKSYLTRLHIKGYGREEGVHNIINSAAIIEDKLVITGFSLLVAIVFTQDTVIMTVLRGPLEVLGGITYGLLTGVLCWFLPDKKHSDKWLLRVLLLLLCGLFAVVGGKALSYPGAGLVACLCTPLVANYKWKRNTYHGDKHPAEYSMNKLWSIVKPVLLCAVGAEVIVTPDMAKQIGLSVCVLLLGCTFRMLTSFCCVLGLGYNVKEKLFFPCAWLSKGLLQCVLCCVAVDLAMYQKSDPSVLLHSQQVVLASLVSIFLTVPLSILLVSLAGPHMLTKSKLHLEECRVKLDLTSTHVTNDDRIEVTAEYETVT